MAPTTGICEDDDEFRRYVRTALERAGYEVRMSATGTEALETFTEQPPDVLGPPSAIDDIMKPR